jgi:pyridoxal phosphate enzyme (YggS family)
MAGIETNYRNIVDRIGEAAAKCGRAASAVKLLGAAKSQNAEAVRAAIAAGLALVGENYVQEAQDKKKAVAERAEWHMIGHLQRNKAKAAVEIFDVIESLDNIALARELDKEGQRREKVVRVFIEVNLGGEKSKSGIGKSAVAALLEQSAPLAHLRIEGLMTVPPFGENPEESRRYFRELAELKEKFATFGVANADLQELSMGMTHDYTVAVQEGATIVRIGTALFGPRNG